MCVCISLPGNTSFFSFRPCLPLLVINCANADLNLRFIISVLYNGWIVNQALITFFPLFQDNLSAVDFLGDAVLYM